MEAAPRLTVDDLVARPHSGMLIAEGGMGKSTFLQTLADKLEGNATFIRLAYYAGNPQGLDDKLKQTFQLPKPHTVILDGLDEAMNLAGTLCCLEGSLPADVYVWIASRGCRPLSTVREALKKIPRYRLLPFTEKDVATRAQEEGIDAAVAVAFIQKHQLIDFCGNPVGCAFVLKAVKQNKNDVSWTVSEIWWQGIRSLCDETASPTKSLDDTASKYPLDRIYTCAAWLALNLSLSGKTAIFIGVSETACPPHAVLVSDLVHDAIIRELIEITLRRGVFEAWGDDCFGFKNATFCDFLAAEGFRAHIPAQNWQSLLLSQEGQCLFPQRMAVAQWLMTDHPALAAAAFAVEPESFLTPALAPLRQNELAQALLARADAVYARLRNDVRPPFSLLQSEATRQTLADFFSSVKSGEQEDVRVQMAVFIVADCGFFELLADFALNSGKSAALRIYALYAICTAPLDIKRRVRPLLDQLDKLDNAQDKWRGMLLQICWPDVLSPVEVLQYLTPVQTSAITQYQLFLENENGFLKPWLEQFEPSMVPDALAWAVRQFDRLNSHTPFNDVAIIAQVVYTRCWEYAARAPEAVCVSLFVDGFLVATDKLQTPFKDSAAPACDDCDLRFAVLRELVNREPSVLATSFCLTYATSALLKTKDDFLRLIGILITEPYSVNAERWGRVIQSCSGAFLDYGLDDAWDKAHSARPDLLALTAYEIRKEREAEQRDREERLRKAREPSENALAKMEADRLANQREVDGWIKKWLADDRLAAKKFPVVCDYLYLKDGVFKDWSHLDMRQSPGWENLSAEEQARVVRAAERFLKEGPAPEFTPRSSTLIWHKALVLLKNDARSAFDVLPETVWRKCAADLMNHCPMENVQCQGLLDDLSNRFPVVAQDTLVHLLSLDAASWALQTWGTRLTEAQADGVWSALFRPVTGEETPCRCFNDFPFQHAQDKQPACCEIIDGLTQFHPDIVRRKTAEYLRDGFGIHLGHPFYDVLRMFILRLNGESYFSSFLQTLVGNLDWGRKFIEGIVESSSVGRAWFYNTVCSRTAEEIGILYDWLQEHYPAKNNPIRTNEVQNVPPLFFVYDLKDRLFTVLLNSGKEGSARIVEEQIKRYGGWEGHIATARRNEAAARLPTLSADRIRELTESKKTVIASIGDLQRQVLSLLNDYQVWLKGKTPAVEDLWDTVAGVPKKEDAVSGHLERFLRDRLPNATFANREVQISRKLAEGGEAGTRTDIWIDCETVCQEKVNLCIEVKRSCNREAKTALADQLVAKYMSPGRADAGILLLAWFHCAAWKANVKKSVWVSSAEAKAELEKQVQAETTDKPLDCFVLDCTL